jgi:DNA-binding NarL/FixJ family response regulator
MSTDPMGFSSARILVVDDHPLVRKHVRAVLGEEGYQVCGEAADGREAVEMAEILKPDLVVLDLTMPELNGLDAARLILGKTPEIHIVIFTMHEDEALTREAAEAGVAACVGKSDTEHLIAKVHALLRPGCRRQLLLPLASYAVGQPMVARLKSNKEEEMVDVQSRLPDRSASKCTAD